jgi:hypothetical protein
LRNPSLKTGSPFQAGCETATGLAGYSPTHLLLRAMQVPLQSYHPIVEESTN